MHKSHRALLALCIFTLAGHAHAQQLAQPISVQADQIQINESTGLSLYLGHVQLVQDGLTITAKQVRVHSAHGKVLSIQASGEPLHFEDQKTGGLPLFGESQTLLFVAADDKVTLTGHAVFRQGVNVLHGHIVRYYVRSRQISAVRGRNHRVRARITPRKTKQGTTKGRP